MMTIGEQNNWERLIRALTRIADALEERNRMTKEFVDDSQDTSSEEPERG